MRLFWRCYPTHALAVIYQRPYIARIDSHHRPIPASDQAIDKK